MNTAPSHVRLSRRSFLKLLAAGGATAAGGYVLYETTPWLDYDQDVASSRSAIAVGATGQARTRAPVRAATLAANGHNTQPWRFAITADAITILPDPARRLPVVDPHDRELWISLGCALENLLVAAQALGYAPEVTYPEAIDAITVRLLPGVAQAGPLFAAIPLRQNTRAPYDGQPIPAADLDQVQTLPLEPGVTLQVRTGAAERELVREYADEAFVAELIAWLRFNFDVQIEATTKRQALEALHEPILRSGRCFITDGGYRPGTPAAMVRYAATQIPGLGSAPVATVFQVNWKERAFFAP